ncbi:MAG: glycerate dehydrogenase [Saprospiraceae bacterium]|nr:MAG: glycerate dehydrogenase [Saprospiraceae bacterium]
MTENHPNIVVLDGYTLNPGDLSWQALNALGKVQIYDHSSPDHLLERASEASILLVNKFVLQEKELKRLPLLKCICVTATGYNNIDIKTAKQLGIKVFNVSDYGSTAVAQHVFALILALTNGVETHHQSVQKGDWIKSRDFSYTLFPLVELAGKTIGIYGFGRIGKKVARIADGFEMKVITLNRHPERDTHPGVTYVDWQTLLETSDFLSLHAPLQKENTGIINLEALKKMKKSARLINTARGGLIVEADLAKALKEGFIAGAGLDVLSQEPPTDDHPLLHLKNCLITPHNAWASAEARQRLLDGSIKNVKAFLNGSSGNIDISLL